MNGKAMESSQLQQTYNSEGSAFLANTTALSTERKLRQHSCRERASPEGLPSTKLQDQGEEETRKPRPPKPAPAPDLPLSYPGRPSLLPKMTDNID
jgi:hypothetical protein